MKSVILPIETNPAVKGYLHHAYTLGMLQSQKEETLPWIYNNYIQLAFTIGYGLNFSISWSKFSDVFDWQHISRELLDDCNISPLDFIRNSLSSGYYIYCSMDEYYIPQRESYLLYKNHHHDTFIYGYDMEADSYNIIGFTDQQIYRPTTINSKVVLKSHPIELNMIRLKENVKYEIHPEYIRQTILEYLYPTNIHERYNMWHVLPGVRLFGLEANSYLSDMFQMTKEGKVNVDYIYTHMLWEHKNCMLNRIKYLLKNDYMTDITLLEKYSEVEKLALHMRNLYLKYYITKNNSLIDRLINDNEAIIKLEKEILPCVAENIKLR